MSGPFRVALGEYDTGWHDPALSLRRAATVVRAGAAAGARLVVLPEMCTTGFTMDASRAEPIDGPSVRGLSTLASDAGVFVLAGVALRETTGAERLVNAALLIDDAGTVRDVYRKQRVFAYAGEHEVYASGGEPVLVDVDGVRIAPFVCYDLRFPELFRTVAREVDAIVVIANWPVLRRAHWDVLVRARAIENQCYVVAVNRTGTGGGLVYDGGSIVYDAWGEPCAEVAAGVGYADIDVERVRAVRADYPFLRDMKG